MTALIGLFERFIGAEQRRRRRPRQIAVGIVSRRASINQAVRLGASLVVVAALMACGERDAFVVGPERGYNAGPSGFTASPISFKGRPLGHAATQPGPQQFSASYWVYRPCAITMKEPGFDGECKDWHVLDVSTGNMAAMDLPGLDSFASDPGFLWPYVAYVQTGKPSTSERRTVHCVLWDFQAKKAVRRQRAQIPEYIFGTDVGGILTPPVFSDENGRTTVAYSFRESDGTQKPLCRIIIP